MDAVKIVPKRGLSFSPDYRELDDNDTVWDVLMKVGRRWEIVETFATSQAAWSFVRRALRAKALPDRDRN